MNYKKALFLSFILIVAISAVNYSFLSENKNHIKYDGYGFSYLCMAIIGLFGYLAWRKYPVGWPYKLWALIYFIGFCILGAIRIMDKFFLNFSTTSKENVQHIRNLFNSPLLFLILYILVRNVANGRPGQPKKRY